MSQLVQEYKIIGQTDPDFLGEELYRLSANTREFKVLGFSVNDGVFYALIYRQLEPKYAEEV